MRNNFKPRYMEYANAKLEKDLSRVQKHQESNKIFKRGVFKTSLWKRFLGFLGQ